VAKKTDDKGKTDDDGKPRAARVAQSDEARVAPIDEARVARRAAELRGNLKRRKSQSRARDETAAPGLQSRQGRKTLIDPV